MAAITSAATGNWSVGGTWVGGVAPTSADTVTIANTHTVTLDTTGLICSTLTVNSGGILSGSSATSWDLTVQSIITVNGAVNIDLSSTSTVTGTFKLNAANSTTDNGSGWFQITDQAGCTIKGYPRKRKTTLTAGITAGATSATVADATGWKVGDIVIFATTQAYNATPRTDTVTLTSVTGNNIGWTGGVTYDHANGGYVGNFTSNVVIRPNTAGFRTTFVYTGQYGAGIDKLLDNVQFFDGFDLNYNSFASVVVSKPIVEGERFTVSNCAFYQFRAAAFIQRGSYGGGSSYPLSGCVMYSDVAEASSTYRGGVCFITAQRARTIVDCGIFRINCTGTGSDLVNGPQSGSGFSAQANGYVYDLVMQDTFASACGNGFVFIGTNQRFTNVESFANVVGATYGYAAGVAGTGFHVGSHNAGAATNGTAERHGPSAAIVLTDSKTQTLALSGLSTASDSHSITYVNKNLDVTSQEIYRPFSETKRNNVTTKRSTSSISIKPTRTATACTRTQSILCANGSTIRVIGYVQRDNAALTATVTLSGLGATPVTFTSSAVSTWQQYDLSITNTSGADGNFTLTYTANSTNTTSTAYFDGVPDSPFVTKCRHYGFNFDEANPVRTVNPAISASEATASAYTGITVTGGASTSPVTITADKTFQYLYDHNQYFAVTNLGFAPSFTATGSAGAPALVALANVTTTGFTLNGGGSLSMGAYTLTGSIPWAYTYTGGTFSQASTVPTFAGGTLAIGNGGTYTFTQASSMTVSVTPAGNTSYTFSAGSFTGTLTVNNTTGTTVTVYVPAGVTTVATGGPVIFSAPIVQQQVVISGFVAGSRIQIYDTTNSVELFNGTASAGNTIVSGSTATWTDPSAAVGNRAIRVRISYVSGATAKTFIESNIGTCGTTNPSNAISYLVNQTNDTTYNSNSVTGSAVTGVTFTDAAVDLVNCNIPGGTIQWKEIYAAFVYWNFTAAGIANDFTYISAPDTANYILSGMKVKNTGAGALSVIGGYGYDATTRASKDIIDTTGGSIFLAPDHVVPFQTSGTVAIQGDVNQVLTAINAVPANTATAVWSKTLP